MGGQIQYGGAAAPQKSGGLPGWAWVLIVLGGISLFIVIAIVACTALFLDAADEAVEDVNDAFEEVPEGDYSIEIEDCEVDEFGSATASGVFTNETGERQGFEIIIEMTEDGTLVESPSTITDTLDDGTETEWEVFGTADEGADIECEVSAVNKTLFDDENEDLFGD